MKNIGVFVLFLAFILVSCEPKNDPEDGSIWNSESQFIQTLESVDIEGSGEDAVVSFPAETTLRPIPADSSIKGIPKVFFKLPKAPAFTSSSTREYRRRQATRTEYASMSPHRQTFAESLLDFLGLKTSQTGAVQPQVQTEDKLMQAFYDNSRKNNPIQPMRAVQSTMHIDPSTYQCAIGLEAAQTFNVSKFMGQWYQVMYTASNQNVNSCRMMSYRLLNLIDIDHYVGSTFETLEYTTDGQIAGEPQMYSGFGMINQPGELYYRSPRGNLNVNIIHAGPENEAGFYQYVILAVECYYPIYVFARDPLVFQQRFEHQVQQVMRNKQLINDFSKVLNFVKTVDFTTCLLPPSFFSG